MEQIKILTLFASIATLISVTHAIKCFQCNSGVESECADLKQNDTSSPFYKECAGFYNGSQAFCRKYVFTVIDADNQNRIHRSCGWLHDSQTQKDNCKKSDSDFLLRTTCECFSEGCNSSSKFVPHLFNFSISIFLVFKYLLV